MTFGGVRRAPFLRGLALACGALLAGCGSLARQTMRASHASPLSLAPTEQRVRDALLGARWEAALKVVRSEKHGGPADRLLRDLYTGTTAFYAGRHDESVAAFERAAALAEDRYTKSIGRGALSLATSDFALPYVPGQNERLMVHYYGLLARLRTGSLEGATVEARRIGFLLQQYDDARTPLDDGTRAVLRLVSGAVFEAAGESNDAAVAFRHARALTGGDPLGVVPRELDLHAEGDSGDVLVVVEQGFVSYRVEQRLTVVGDRDGDWRLFAGSGDRAVSGADAIARAASLLTGDAGLWADGAAARLALGDPIASHEARARIAWPAYRRPAPLPHAMLVLGPATAVPLLRADLSAAAAGDFRRDRAARLARLLARAALREGAAEALATKHRELASVVRGVGAAIERADTRSWHLLPGAVSVARLRLPAGEHTITVDVDGARMALGVVRVEHGRLALATARLWNHGAPAAIPALTSTLP